MESTKLSAGTGWLWIKQGTYLFKKSPVLWMAITLIGIVGLLVISNIPMVGDPLATLIFPVIFSGLLWGCHALEHDEELELAHLFMGFQRSTQQLVTLGGLNLILQLLILGVMMLTGGAALVDILISGTQPDDPSVLIKAVTGAGIAILIGAALFAVLLMATQFAPMLVTFDKVAPLDALKASLRGCLNNIAPLSVYGVMMMLFAIAASLPMMLGWIILLPIMITSIYAAYRGMFPTPEERAASTTEAADPAQETPPPQDGQ